MWGVHHFAFLPLPVSLGLALLMAAGLLLQVQRAVGVRLERWTGLSGSVPRWTRFLLILGGASVLTSLFWYFRQETFFLGDGYLVIRNLSGLDSAGDIPGPFPTAPLPASTAYLLRNLLSSFGVENAALAAWQLQSILLGLLTVPLARGIAAVLADNPVQKALMTALVLVGGAAQFSFGYVETYPAAYAGTLLFLWLAMRSLTGKGGVILTSAAYGVLFALHFGMLSFLPALVFLWVVEWIRGRKTAVAGGIVLAVAAAAVFLAAAGYTPETLWRVLIQGPSFLLPLSVQDQWQAAYALFSLWHLVDIANAYLLFSPFVFLLVPVALWAYTRDGVWRKPGPLFLALALAGGLGWTFLTNLEVGMSRDWDVLAPASAGVVLFGLYGLRTVLAGNAGMNRVLAMITIVTLAHSAAWIGVNAQEDASMSRYVHLQDSRVRSWRAVAYACEDIAGFYRDRKEYQSAILFQRKVVEIDSTNARRWLSLAYLQQLAEQRGEAIHSYEQSVRRGMRDKAAFFNLGVLYHGAGRSREAVRALQTAAEIDPADTLVARTLRDMR